MIEGYIYKHEKYFNSQIIEYWDSSLSCWRPYPSRPVLHKSEHPSVTTQYEPLQPDILYRQAKDKTIESLLSSIVFIYDQYGHELYPCKHFFIKESGEVKWNVEIPETDLELLAFKSRHNEYGKLEEDISHTPETES